MTKRIPARLANQVWQLDCRFMSAVQSMLLGGADQRGATPDAADDVVREYYSRQFGLDAVPVDDLGDGCKVLHVAGVLWKRPRGWEMFGSTYRVLSQALEGMLANVPAAVVVRIDSPGGQVDGLAGVCELLGQLAEKCLVVAYVDGMACSAAYRLASQCGSVWAATDSEVGSLGTLFQGYDYSAAFEQEGIRSVLIATGEFKGLGAVGEPVTESQVEFLRAWIDERNAALVADVMTGRGLSAEQYAAVSDGRWYSAAAGVGLGLVDGLASFGDVLAAVRAQVNGLRGVDMPKAKLEAASVTAVAGAVVESGASQLAAVGGEPVSVAGIGGDAAGTESAAAAVVVVSANSAGPTRVLGDYMEAFGDAEGARFFRDGVAWDDAAAQTIAALRGRLQDVTAEKAQISARFAEYSKSLGAPAGLNISESGVKEKKSFGEACRAANKPRD